jgi:hypothetical protein
MNIANFDIKNLSNFVVEKFAHISAETLGWLAVIIIHSATIPSLLAVMAGLTDKMPSADIILLAWGGLTLLFVKAAVQRDMLNIITIGLGFIIQSVLMVLIFFK